MTTRKRIGGLSSALQSDADAAVLAAEPERLREIFHPGARTRRPTKFLHLAAEPAAALAIEAVRGTVSQLPL
jgi:hypothetical protein